MAETIIVPTPSAAELDSRVDALAIGATLVIDTPEMREIVIDDIKALQAEDSRQEALRVELTAPLNSVVKKLNDLFRPRRERIQAEIACGKRAVLTYDEAVRAKAEAEARARAAALAQEKARMEAEAKAKADEAARREQEEREAQQRAEQLKVSAEIAAAQGDGKAAETAAQAAIEEERKAAEARASRELAEAQAASTAAAATMATAPVPAGLARAKGTTKRWKWEVKDKLAAIKFIAANPAYLHVVDIDSKVMNQMATAMKDTFPVDGIRVYAEAGLTVRGAA